MKPRNCRRFLKGWRHPILSVLATGALSLSGSAQERRMSPSVLPQPKRTISAISPEEAARSIEAGEKAASSSRIQAINSLGASGWQSDVTSEGIMISALRSDASESVRAQTALVFAKASYVTPKVHDALQCCAYGSSRDGFPGERSATVKWQAAEALKKHPTSGNPRQIAIMQMKNAQRNVTLEAPAGALVRERSEESSPPERTSTFPHDPTPLNPQLTPSLAPPPPINATLPASGPHSAVKTVGPKTLPDAPLPPIPSPLRDSALKPVSVPESLPSARTIPTTTDRTPPATTPELKAPAALPPLDSTVTLRQRRNELRDLGLQDSTLKLFTEQVGAPPPNMAKSSSWFRSPSAGSDARPTDLPALAKPEQPKALPGTFVSRPNLPTEPDPAPRPGAWNRLFARFQSTPAVEETQPPATNDSPRFLSRILPSRFLPAAADEPTERIIEVQEVTPVSTNPVRR